MSPRHGRESNLQLPQPRLGQRTSRRLHVQVGSQASGGFRRAWARETFLTLRMSACFWSMHGSGGNLGNLRHQRSPVAAGSGYRSGDAAPRWPSYGVWDAGLAQALSQAAISALAGESKTFLFWEHCRARAVPEDTFSVTAHEPGYRLSCREGWSAAERARFQKEATARRSWITRRRDDQVLRALASGPQQDRAAWPRQNTWDATCRSSLITPSRDEIHRLAGDTAQGNALGILNRTARRFLGLTGTLLSGYADDLFNTLIFYSIWSPLHRVVSSDVTGTQTTTS